MALVRRDANQSKPDEALVLALREYENVLSDDERIQLRSEGIPDALAALNLTTRIDQECSSNRRHCVGTRLTTILASVQHFSTAVDTFVDSNPEIAALIWGGVKVALLVCRGSLMEFMAHPFIGCQQLFHLL